MPSKGHLSDPIPGISAERLQQRSGSLLRLLGEASALLFVSAESAFECSQARWVQCTAAFEKAFPLAKPGALLTESIDPELAARLFARLDADSPNPPQPFADGIRLDSLGNGEWLVRLATPACPDHSPTAAAPSSHRRTALTPEQRWKRKLLHSLPGGIVIIGLDGHIDFVNQAARVMFRDLLPAIGTIEEALGHLVIVDSKGRELAPASCFPWERLLAGEAVRGQIRGVYLRGRHQIRWFEVHLVPIRSGDGRGPVAEVVLSILDVTAMRTADVRLTHLVKGLAGEGGNEFLRGCVRHLAESMNAPYALVGRYVAGERERIRCQAVYLHGEMVDFFEYELAGSPCEQVVGRQMCLFPRDVQLLFPQDQVLVELGVQAYIGVPLQSAAGEPLGLLAVMWTEPLKNHQPFENLLHVFASRAAMELERQRADEDLRQMMQQVQEERRRAEGANRAKSEFLATVSHEIRTPLNAIIGTVDLLGVSSMNEEQRVDLQVVRESARSLLRLIDDLLDLSRIEAGRLRPEQAEFSLRDLLARVGRMAQMQAERKHLTFAVAMGENLPDRVLGDQVRIGQILMNLLGNAVKFTETGSVVLRCDLRRVDAGVADLCWEVADTGIGVPPEVQGRVFEPFVQGDVGFTRRYGGTGLGLAISLRLAHLMGGSIDFASDPGKGSTFRLRLQLKLAEPLTTEGPVEMAATRLTGSPYVLLVEDNLVNQRVGCRLLDRLGCQVDVASNGEQALDLLRARRYEAILMDCQMPVMDGFQTTRAIRDNTSGLNTNTVIIALTANAMAGDRERCLSVGMNDYLAKPITLAELTSVLSRWLPAHLAGGIPSPGRSI